VDGRKAIHTRARWSAFLLAARTGRRGSRAWAGAAVGVGTASMELNGRAGGCLARLLVHSAQFEERDGKPSSG
jgi:hypothetical protein